MATGLALDPPRATATIPDRPEPEGDPPRRADQLRRLVFRHDQVALVYPPARPSREAPLEVQPRPLPASPLPAIIHGPEPTSMPEKEPPMSRRKPFSIHPAGSRLAMHVLVTFALSAFVLLAGPGRRLTPDHPPHQRHPRPPAAVQLPGGHDRQQHPRLAPLPPRHRGHRPPRHARRNSRRMRGRRRRRAPRSTRATSATAPPSPPSTTERPTSRP